MITSVSKPPQQALLPVLGRWQSHERGWRALLEDNHGTDHVLSQCGMAGHNSAPTMPDESTARVALATCAQVPELDRDTKTLLFPRGKS